MSNFGKSFQIKIHILHLNLLRQTISNLWPDSLCTVFVMESKIHLSLCCVAYCYLVAFCLYG